MTASIESVERRREELPTLPNGVDRLSHSLGPMPRGAYDEMQRYVDRWRDHTDTPCRA